MNTPTRFLFDECIAKSVMEEVALLTGTPSVCTHVIEYLGQGAKDRDWIPALAAEGGWAVVTSDGGKQSVKREKLPNLCLAHKLVHFVLSPKLHDSKSPQKAAALISLWSQIEEAAANPASLRYTIGIKTSRSIMTVEYKLWSVPDRVDPPGTQGAAPSPPRPDAPIE